MSSLRLTSLSAIVWVVFAACGRVSDRGEELIVESRRDSIICGSDNRTAISTLTFPRGAVGRLNVGCSATIIDFRKILTAAHCIGNTAPSSIVFSPQFGIITPGTGPQSATGVRIVQGRDATDTELWADWAIITLDQDLSSILGANFQNMARVIPTAAPFSSTLYGYHGDLFSNRPGTETCTANVLQNGVLFHDCDVVGGASGGPFWRMNGSIAELVGVQSAHGSGTCAGTTGNTAASGLSYAFAPDNAGGVAAAHASDGRTTVYASDRDWTLIGVRQKTTTVPGSAWTPWNANESAFSGGGRKMAAVNVADNREQIWVVDASGVLKTRWQTCTDGCWSGWSTHSTPVNVVDVAATGDVNVTTHLFILGTDGTIRASNKTGGASSSWSGWTTIGTQSGANALTGVYFSGVHQIFVSHSSGAHTAWGASGSYTGLFDFGPGFAVRAISAGTLQDGRVSVFGVINSGTLTNLLVNRIRAADGSSWSAWTAMPQNNPTNTNGFVTIASGREIDGRQQLFGIADNGEIYTVWEVSSGTFSSNWVRFYK